MMYDTKGACFNVVMYGHELRAELRLKFSDATVSDAAVSKKGKWLSAVDDDEVSGDGSREACCARFGRCRSRVAPGTSLAARSGHGLCSCAHPHPRMTEIPVFFEKFRTVFSVYEVKIMYLIH